MRNVIHDEEQKCKALDNRIKNWLAHGEKTIVYFNTRDEMVKINLHNVVYFQADRNYTDIYFINGAHVTLTTGLVNIEKMLDTPKLRGGP